ncbi:related to ankyrin [Fusarium proliferatum]|nr:related to ankyrin [Fusarium proliferatum]
MPPSLLKDKLPYGNFIRGPKEHHNDDEPPYTPMTMVDGNESVLCETGEFDLLLAIVHRDDVMTLEQYLDIAPWVIEEREDLPLFYSFFYTAVSHGSLGALRTLLSYYERVMGPIQRITFRKRGFTLLNEAARRGYLEIVEFLLQNQPLYADIHERDYTGCTAIAAASDLYSTRYAEAFNWQPSVDKSEAVINLLLEWGACPTDVVAPAHEDSSWKPETIISMASEWASAKIIERLVNGGADVHARFTKDSLQLRLYDEQDYIVDNVTAIHMASFRGNYPALKTLLAHRGDAISALQMVSSCDSRGSTPLHWATRNNLFNPNPHESAQNIKATIDLILGMCPGIVNIQDIEGNTALHYASRYLEGNGEVFMPIFETICDKGGDASIRNNRGETPLHNVLASAEETVDQQIISLLLAHGAKISDIDYDGNTPLHIAARRLDNHGVIAFLTKQGADTAIRNSKNETPVHIAAAGDVSTSSLAEKVEMQNRVLAILTSAGGVGLLDSPDAKGKTPREICKEQRSNWKKNEDRDCLINRRRERDIASTTPVNPGCYHK